MMDSFVLYRSVFDALMASEPETCKETLELIGRYAMDGKVPERPGNAFAMFLTIRPLLDARAKKIAAGRAGGNKKAENAKMLQNATGKVVAEPSKTVAEGWQTLPKEESRKKKEENIKDNKEILSGKPDPIPYSEIVSYLNQKAGKRYQAGGRTTKRLIKARWEDGWRLEDFKTVIDNMTAKWKGDPKMDEYLRPVTLFGTKFEEYLNATPQKAKPANRFVNFESRERTATENTDLERRLLGL